MNHDLIIVGLATGIVIILVALTLMRKVVLWYYRIDDRIKLMEEIRDELKRLNSK